MKLSSPPPESLVLVASPAPTDGADSGPLVLSAPAGTEVAQGQGELRDIHGPLPLPGQPPLLAIAAGVVLAIAVFYLLYRLWQRRHRRKATPPPQPWDEALRALNEARSLLEAGDRLAYLERCAAILRAYIERHFALPSTRQTTREFLDGLGTDSASPLALYRQELQALLERADLAKFAHHAEDKDPLAGVEASLRRFIEGTIPRTANGGGQP